MFVAFQSADEALIDLYFAAQFIERSIGSAASLAQPYRG